jgi:hypothetical protein
VFHLSRVSNISKCPCHHYWLAHLLDHRVSQRGSKPVVVLILTIKHSVWKEFENGIIPVEKLTNFKMRLKSLLK